MKNLRIPFLGLTLLIATPAFADDAATVIGAAVGGAAGTAISQNTNQSRNATILWSAIGAGAGAAVGRKLGAPHGPQVVAAPAYAQPTHSPAYYSGAQPVYYRAYDDDWRGAQRGWNKHRNKQKHGRGHHDDDD